VVVARQAEDGAFRLPPWKPVLEGVAADRAAVAVDAIARSLSESHAPSVASERQYPSSLAFGDAGLALFFGYLAQTQEGAGARRTALDLLDAALSALAEDRMPRDLSCGIAGIGWVYQHLSHRLWDPQRGDDPCSDLDDALRAWCDRPGIPAELLTGLAGLSLYAVERLPAQTAAQLAERIVARLEETADRMLTGRSWRVSESLARGFQKAARQQGLVLEHVYQLAPAHGAVGPAAALAALHANGFATESLRRLIETVVVWILSQRLGAESPTAFPPVVGLPFPARTTGWCNGDLGTAVTLFTIGRSLGQRSWEEAALDIASRAVGTSVGDIEPFNRGNAALCHGSAGRAILFARLFQATGDERLLEAARYWFGHCLDLRRPGEGIGGFQVDEPGEGGLKTVRGFLMGAAGVGLALLAATTDVAPDWDRLLLASVRTP
jgi:hypothetical protein